MDELTVAALVVVDTDILEQGDYKFIADLTLLPYPNPFSVAGE